MILFILFAGLVMNLHELLSKALVVILFFSITLISNAQEEELPDPEAEELLEEPVVEKSVPEKKETKIEKKVIKPTPQKKVIQKEDKEKKTTPKPKVKTKAKTGNQKSKKSPIKNRTPSVTDINEEEDSMSGTIEWQVVLKDDNGNIELPKRYRTWWYVRLDGVNPNNESRLHIIGDGFQGGSVVLPVYSYDKQNWTRLRPENIIRGEEKENDFNYTVVKRFGKSPVYVARYYPYPYARVKKLVNKYKSNKYFKSEILGKTAHGRDMYFFTITDPSIPDKDKKRIWIHSRTHPSETGASFAVEGMLEYLLGKCNENCREADLTKLIFNIVPMVNIDGVVEGRARVTPDSSYDLERMWIINPKNYRLLTDSVPPEVKLMHTKILELDKSGPEFIAAINIHTKNAYPEWKPFIYSNFKPENKDFGSEADTLFRRQLGFMKLLSEEYCCADTLTVQQSFESNIPMEKKKYPEAWWWLNYKDKVMAATLELTSGYDGGFEEWSTYRDNMMLGEALCKALYKYYRLHISGEYFRYEAPEQDIEKLIKYYRGPYKLKKKKQGK